MKISEVPSLALDALPTPIPTKTIVSYDWHKFYTLLVQAGFAVIECNEDEIRTTKAGGREAAPVKALNVWVRNNFGRHIKSVRLGENRWFITL
jgi:hypothetical protein